MKWFSINVKQELKKNISYVPYIIYIYLASQKYTGIIIKDLQYIYKTLRFKITAFYSFVYIEG